LVQYRQSSSVLIRLGNQAVADYLRGKGFLVAPYDVDTVSGEIYDAYTSFAEKSLLEIDSHIIYTAILYRLGVSDFSDRELISGAINSFYNPTIDDYYIFEGVEEVLGPLRERGLRLGLVTNNDSMNYHQRLLGKFGLERFFDSIVVSCILGVRKPHRLMFLRCLKELGVSNRESVFVGDRPRTDVEGARNAGIRSIWLRRDGQKEASIRPDWTAQSLGEVEAIIASQLN